jgi:hypothetical protein
MKYFLGVLLVMLLLSLAQAQEVGQADIRITSFQATTNGTNIHLVIDVASNWDDDAHNARLVILFPPGVRAVGSTLPRDSVPGASCHAVGSPGAGYQSQVRCYLGQLATNGPNSERHIEFDVRIVLAFTSKNFGAFVSSDTPEPQPANNFATATP